MSDGWPDGGETGDACACDAASPQLSAMLLHLRTTVATYVAERRGAGMSAPRVLGEVRCLVREAESCEDVVIAPGLLLRYTLAWAAEAYGHGGIGHAAPAVDR